MHFGALFQQNIFFVSVVSRVSRLCERPGYTLGSEWINFPVDEVTVSVDEKTGKSVFIDREK